MSLRFGWSLPLYLLIVSPWTRSVDWFGRDPDEPTRPPTRAPSTCSLVTLARIEMWPID